MIEAKRPFSCPKSKSEFWTIDGLNAGETEPERVIRKFINSAIYVEKPLKSMAPFRKDSVFINSNKREEYFTPLKVKRCTCAQNSTNCPCHQDNIFSSHIDMKESTDYLMSKCSSLSDLESQVTIKQGDNSQPKPDTLNGIKLSLSKLTGRSTCTADMQEKEEVINNWLMKKEEEKRKRLEEEARIREQKMRERQMILEKERENFKKWLAEKKQNEERSRRQKEKEMEEKQLEEADKSKKQIENQLMYQLWLQRKKKNELEKKIKEQMELLKTEEDKQRRIEENEKAYQRWLKNSKSKPKPIPMNQGLKSLCSSLSVTYINPVPWTPNIEIDMKPSSHSQ